jgi:glyoxylase-like metal-dependent hydrolase (beta-lactamase superfamily II)
MEARAQVAGRLNFHGAIEPTIPTLRGLGKIAFRGRLDEEKGNMWACLARLERWRSRWVGSLIVLIVVAVPSIAYLQHRVGRATRLVTDHMPLLRPSAITIAPGLHLLGGLEPAAAYVVETSKGLVLVDSGLQDNASLLKSQLAILGFDWRHVRVVLLTHAHGDHCGGAEHLRAVLGAKVYAGRGDSAVLRAGGPREAFFSIFSMPNDNPHPTTVDVELKGGESVVFGNVRFLALATPGHTPGSICYLMEQADLRALFAGDVISMLRGDEESHTLERQALGIYSVYLPPRYRGDARAYLSSLRELRLLPVPDLILPGHPRAETEPQSPCLSHQGWRGLLDQGIRDMETLLARFKADGADFLDGNPKRLLPDLYYLGDFKGTAIYGFFASSKFFLVDASGGPGLKEFVKTRLVQLGLKPAEPTAVLLTSCGAEATAGLKELVEKCPTQVVASPLGLQSIRESCPAGTVILPAEELPNRGWFKVTPMLLRGRGLAPMAYLLSWAGKTVLFSGRIPIRLTVETWAELFSDISKSREATADYLISVNRLGELKPDLWLPTVTTAGRNANLYGSEWEDIVAENYRAGHSALISPR